MVGLMLQWFPGYSFSDLLNQLENLGFFAYVFPFLLIFAVIYAVLTQIKIFEDNKGAAVIVALMAGLLSLQLDFVPAFFHAIFPRLGIGISVLLVALILAGAFIVGGKSENAFKWIFFGIGAFIFIIITLSSVSSFQFLGVDWWQRFGGLIVFLFIIAGVIVAVSVAGKKAGT